MSRDLQTLSRTCAVKDVEQKVMALSLSSVLIPLHQFKEKSNSLIDDFRLIWNRLTGGAAKHAGLLFCLGGIFNAAKADCRLLIGE